MQTPESGGQAVEDGYSIAWAVADALGLKLVEPRRSNRCLDGNKIGVIKSVREGGTRFEITKAMFPELDFALLAIESTLGQFEVYRIPKAALEARRLSSTGWKSKNTQWAFDVGE